MIANQNPPALRRRAPRLPRETSPPRRRILVVDDEPLIRQLYVETLADSGYQVDSAEDGAVAWEALQASPYDLLITDYLMPKVSGVELLKHIYATQMFLPVIMATATFPEEVFIRHPELQPKITLLKPHTASDLLGVVEEVLCPPNRRCAGLLPPPVYLIRPSLKPSQL